MEDVDRFGCYNDVFIDLLVVVRVKIEISNVLD